MIKNIIWQTTAGDYTNFELQYLQEYLFKHIEYTPIFDQNRCEVFLDNSLIVYSSDEPELQQNLKNYLRKYDELGYTYYLLHLSNERLNHNFEYYKRAKHVFRGYYDPRIELNNVSTIPIGFKSGFLNTTGETTTVYDKEYIWTFIGQIAMKRGREEMYNVLKQIEPNYTHVTHTWNCQTALTVNHSIEIYKKSIFTPVPPGWVNPDSFRINEVLEWGCIPVFVLHNGQDYFKNVYGEHPFLSADTWDDVYTKIIELCNDFDELEKYRLEIQNFYCIFKSNLQNKIKDILI
jgi:hypothetical protein